MLLSATFSESKMALLFSSPIATGTFRSSSSAALRHFVRAPTTVNKSVSVARSLSASASCSSPVFLFNCQSTSRTFRRCRMAGFVSASTVAEQSIYDFTVKDIDGKDVSLSQYKGKVLLIVNVASRCGLTTSNYNELAEIYSNLKGQDFEILAFPCNQFGGQEPGSNQQIKEFACSRFKAEYPIFDKVEVNGDNTAPVYKFLKASKSTGLLGSLLGDNIKWNFEKFLVDKDGNVVQRYEPTTSPLKIENDIKKLLEA